MKVCDNSRREAILHVTQNAAKRITWLPLSLCLNPRTGGRNRELRSLIVNWEPTNPERGESSAAELSRWLADKGAGAGDEYPVRNYYRCAIRIAPLSALVTSFAYAFRAELILRGRG